MIRKIEERSLHLGEYLKGQNIKPDRQNYYKIRLIAVADKRYIPLEDILSLKKVEKTPIMLMRDIVDIYLEPEKKVIKAIPEYVFYDYLECEVKQYNVLIGTPKNR